MKKYGVVIINFRNLDNVREAVESIFAHDENKQLHPIIVDNQASLSAQELLPVFGKDRLTVLESAKNLGFTGANNLGMRWAKKHLDGEFVFLLNDDTKVDASTFPPLIRFLNDHPQAGAVVPKIYFYPEYEFHQGYGQSEVGQVIWYAGGVIDWTEVNGFHLGVDEVDRGQFSRPAMTDFATGCCVGYRWQALDAVGVFDDAYFLYFEDTDLSQRLWKAGWEIWVEPQAALWHKNAGSSGGSGSVTHQYYQTRNRYRFGFRYAPWRAKLFLLKHLWLQLRHGSRMEKRAILDVLTQNYGQRTHFPQQ